MRYICVLLIRFYQKFLSPLKRNPTCRFRPSCSAYAVTAYLKRGVIMGTLLTAWRILRCNPMCPGGYDPVPCGYLYRNEINLWCKKDELDNHIKSICAERDETPAADKEQKKGTNR